MKKPKIAIRWNEVTPFSRYLAMFLFIIFPFVGFYLGMQQKIRTQPNVDRFNMMNKTYDAVLADIQWRIIGKEMPTMAQGIRVPTQWSVESRCSGAGCLVRISDLGGKDTLATLKQKGYRIDQLNRIIRLDYSDADYINRERYTQILHQVCGIQVFVTLDSTTINESLNTKMGMKERHLCNATLSYIDDQISNPQL
ncbi:MAG: hypothetical protein WCO78_01440 [Candidatus Roizmanbacteria bacterium]